MLALSIIHLNSKRSYSCLILLYNAFFEVLCQISPDLRSGAFGSHFGYIMLNHQLHQLLETGLSGIPAEFGLGFGGIAPEVYDIGGTVEVFTDGDDGLADKSFGTTDDYAFLVKTLAFEAEFDASVAEGQLGELADAVLHTCGDDEVLGTVVLQDKPHTLHIVLGIAPVAQGVEVTQVQAILQTLADTGSSEGDLAGDEGLATALRLVIEKDAGAAEHIVGLAIFFHDPEAVKLGHSIGTIGMERGIFVLGNFFYLAIELGSRGLIDTAGLLQMAGAHSLEHAEYTSGIDISREFRRVETDLHMALGCQVVYLVGTDFVHDLDYGHGVTQVGIVQMEMGLALQMSDALAEVNAAAADYAVHFVALI